MSNIIPTPSQAQLVEGMPVIDGQATSSVKIAVTTPEGLYAADLKPLLDHYYNAMHMQVHQMLVHPYEAFQSGYVLLNGTMIPKQSFPKWHKLVSYNLASEVDDNTIQTIDLTNIYLRNKLIDIGKIELESLTKPSITVTKPTATTTVSKPTATTTVSKPTATTTVTQPTATTTVTQPTATTNLSNNTQILRYSEPNKVFPYVGAKAGSGIFGLYGDRTFVDTTTATTTVSKPTATTTVTQPTATTTVTQPTATTTVTQPTATTTVTQPTATVATSGAYGRRSEVAPTSMLVYAYAFFGEYRGTTPTRTTYYLIDTTGRYLGQTIDLADTHGYNPIYMTTSPPPATRTLSLSGSEQTDIDDWCYVDGEWRRATR